MRLTKVTQADGTDDEAVTWYEYDGHDNLISVTDAEGKETLYSYNDAGLLIKTEEPDNATTVYEYDGAGNLISKTDANGITVNYEYDALNRLIRIDYPDDKDTEYTYDETDVINGRGRLTKVVDASGTTRYWYDTRGNITKQQYTIDTVTYTTMYKYNRNNQVTEITYPDNTVVQYTLNSIGNITTVKVGGTQIASDISYEPFGGIKSMEYDLNSIDTTVTRDDQYRITRIQAGTIIDRTYTYDYSGNIIAVKQNTGDTLPKPEVYAGSDTYAYVTGTDRIEKITGGKQDFTYSYDADGNIISDGVRTFTYNQAGRLKEVSMGSVARFTYNAKGQRVKKEADGNVTVYHYDLQGNLISETDESGNLIADYVYAGSTRIAMIDDAGSVY